MSRDWQWGDVAMVTARGVTRPAVKGALRGWYGPDGYLPDDDVTDAHPLAVIDPEDRGQVERLVVLLGDHGWRPTEAHGLRAALREFANPTPKPPEPLGLGAVVEDVEGQLWVRVDRKDDLPSCWQPCNRAVSQPQRGRYADISAVRVLSEGVAE